MPKPQNTKILSDLLQNQNQQTQAHKGTATLGPHQEVILLIRGMPERLLLTEEVSYTLGRFNMKSNLDKEVDLSPYGAAECGVSRRHARLHLEGSHVYLTDLDSTNGTYVSGSRLEANQPNLLHKGDEVLLARLQVQILFR